MEHLYKFLLTIAFNGLFVSAMLSQITYNMCNFTGGFTVSSTNIDSKDFSSLQAAIDFIKDDANGKDCTIYFGNGTNPLELDGGYKTLIRNSAKNYPV